MKFTIEEAVVQQTAKNEPARMTLILSQYKGDKSIDPSEVKYLNLKNKILETEGLITDGNIVVGYSGVDLVHFLTQNKDIYAHENFEWNDDIKMFVIGNYLFPNQIKEDAFTIKAIKDLVNASRK